MSTRLQCIGAFVAVVLAAGAVAPGVPSAAGRAGPRQGAGENRVRRAARTEAARIAYVRMDSTIGREAFAEAVRLAGRDGASLRHRVYPYAAMGEVPSGSEVRIAGIEGVKDVFVGVLARGDLRDFGERELDVADAYNAVYFGVGDRSDRGAPQEGAPGGLSEPIRIDPGPLRIPDEHMEKLSRAAGLEAAAGRPATSEFFLGDVAVGVIMPESDGVGSQDWSREEEKRVVRQVIEAMDYWAEHAPEHDLCFTYEMNYRVPVGVEPLDRGGWTIQDMWVGQSLTALGYSGDDYFGQAYAYVEDMRSTYGTDWGFIVFVLHGREGQDFGNFLAYAYLGGPFNVSISSNGGLGPERLDRVIAHETGHIFYTLDEYRASPHDCSARSGYLNVENANKVDGGSGCKLSVPCVMRGADASYGLDDLPPCEYTRGQVGWWDTDEDGIPDVLDVDPAIEELELDEKRTASVFSGDTLYSGTGVFSGEVVAVPLANANPFSDVTPRDVTIEPVRAEFRIDGGVWTPCEPDDGEFDSPRERFHFTVAGLAPWQRHAVEVRGVTLHGNTTPPEEVASLGFVSVPAPGGRVLLRVAGSSPARPPVKVVFSTPIPTDGTRTSPVDVSVYDPMGRLVATLASGDFPAGRYNAATWNGLDGNGRRAPAGVYLVALRSAGGVATQKIVIVP